VAWRGCRSEPKTDQFPFANLPHGDSAQTQITFTLATAVAVVVVVFITGFLLGMLLCHWMMRRRN
jgi:hypothetical protein